MAEGQAEPDHPFIHFWKNCSLYMLLLPVISAMVVAAGFAFTLNLSFAALPVSFVLSGFVIYWISGHDVNKTLRPLYLILPLFLICIYLFTSVRDTSIDSWRYHLQRVYLMADGWNPVWQQHPPQWTLPGGDLLWPGSSDNLDHLRITSFAQAAGYANLALYVWVPVIECSLVWHLFLFLATVYPVWNFCRRLRWMGRPLAILFSVVAASNSIVMLQMLLHWIDGMQASLFTIAFFSLLGYVKEPKKCTAVFSVAALAYLFCVKSTGAVYGVLLLGGFVVMVVLANRGRLKKCLRHVAVPAVLLAAVLGINPYLTNIIHYHNPVYPYGGGFSEEDSRDMQCWRETGATQSDWSIDSGRVSKYLVSQIYSGLKNIADLTLSNPSGGRFGSIGNFYGLGAVLSFVVFLAALFVCLVVGRKRGGGKDWVLWLCAGVVLLMAGFFHSDTNIARFFPSYWMLPLFLVLVALWLVSKNMFALSTKMIRAGAWGVCIVLLANSVLSGVNAVRHSVKTSMAINRVIDEIKDNAAFFEVYPSQERAPLIHCNFYTYPVIQMLRDHTGLPMKISMRNNLPIVFLPYIPVALRYQPKAGLAQREDYAMNVSSWGPATCRAGVETRLWFKGYNITRDTQVFLAGRQLDSFLGDDGMTLNATIPANLLLRPGQYSGSIRNRFYKLDFVVKSTGGNVHGHIQNR